MGAVAAARVAGKTPANFKISNDNLGNEVALDMAQNGFIAGIGSQRPFDQGVAEAKLAALAMIGQPTRLMSRLVHWPSTGKTLKSPTR